ESPPQLEPTPRVEVTESDDAVTVSTGALEMVISRRSPTLFSTLSRGGVPVARDGRLVSLHQDNVHDDNVQAGPGSVSREAFSGEVTAVVLEQRGPVRAVVRLEGSHRPDSHAGDSRSWL